MPKLSKRSIPFRLPKQIRVVISLSCVLQDQPLSLYSSRATLRGIHYTNRSLYHLYHSAMLLMYFALRQLLMRGLCNFLFQILELMSIDIMFLCRLCKDTVSIPSDRVQSKGRMFGND